MKGVVCGTVYTLGLLDNYGKYINDNATCQLLVEAGSLVAFEMVAQLDIPTGICQLQPPQ